MKQLFNDIGIHLGRKFLRNSSEGTMVQPGNGVEMTPVMVPESPAASSEKRDIYQWIERGKNCFREWYQPVDFGEGVVAHVTLPPDWKPHPELIHSNDNGLAKWNYIVKKHIPDVRGKRVLDLGCSSGVFSIELARLGAGEVIGVDRDETIRHRSTKTPPAQNVVAQANFVKRAFELIDKIEYPVTYIAHDIGQLHGLELGRFDLILSLAVIYHELDRMPNLVNYLATLTDHLVLQTSKGHSGELGRWADEIKIAETLLDAGFSYVEIDAPSGYSMPMIIGRKGDSVP